MKTEKILDGYYKVFGKEYFANVKKENREWLVEIRFNSSGDMRQFAGLWNRKADAISEAKRIIGRFEN